MSPIVGDIVVCAKIRLRCAMALLPLRLHSAHPVAAELRCDDPVTPVDAGLASRFRLLLGCHGP